MKGKNPEAHPAVVLRPADDSHCSLHHFQLGGGEAEDFRFRLAPWGELLMQLGLGSEALLLAGQPGFSDQLTWAELLDPLGDGDGFADLVVSQPVSGWIERQ